jgi:glycerol-3-phosphate acyltransferase PlsX
LRIAVDAMGGDFAPGDVIKGAVIGARNYGTGLILVGPRTRIEKELADLDTPGLDIEIVHTDEYLIEGEAPAYALRTKRSASIVLAVKLLKEGQAAAVISNGPTGGIVSAALMHLGTLEGISRPVAAGEFCGFAPQTVVLDIGGSLDCPADQLLDFAIIGTVYARKIMAIPDPKVALLNVGAEEGKGNAVCKEAYTLLRQSGLNFAGNIEGHNITSGQANVIVCDGFTGNVITKFCEGLGKSIVDWLMKETANDLPEARKKIIAGEILSRTIKAESGGGGPFWGINGLVLKCHGRARYPEIALTVGNAKKYAELDIVNAQKNELEAIHARLKKAETQGQGS